MCVKNSAKDIWSFRFCQVSLLLKSNPSVAWDKLCHPQPAHFGECLPAINMPVRLRPPDGRAQAYRGSSVFLMGFLLKKHAGMTSRPNRLRDYVNKV